MLIEIIVIVLTIFIIYQFYNYKKCSNFTTIRPQLIPSSPIQLEEVFEYPNCINSSGCLSVSNQIKPFFKYNISDSRCVKNTTPSFIVKNKIDDIISYTSDYSALLGLTGCRSDYNSIYSSVTGRYIVIESNASIRMSGISVYSKLGVLLNISSGFMYNNGRKIIIDLNNDIELGYIEITHANTADSATLNESKIYVFGSTAVDPYDIRNKVFSYIIPSSNTPLTRRIYTQSFIGTDSSTGYVTDSINWSVPTCTGCTQINNNLYKNFKYNVSDGRCFRPKTYTVSKDNLNSIIGLNDLNTMETYFASCSAITDTRFIAPTGRYVIIKKTGLNSTVSLKTITIYGDISEPILTPLTAYAHPLSGTFYGENAIDNNATTVAKATGMDPYILIDLGSDKKITRIVIVPDTDTSGIIGATLSVVKQDYTVVSNNIITSNNYDISIYLNYSDRMVSILNIPLIKGPLTTGLGFTINGTPTISNLFTNQLFGVSSMCINSNIKISTAFVDIPSNTDYSIQGWVKINNNTGTNIIFTIAPYTLQIVNGSFQLIQGIPLTLTTGTTSVSTGVWTFFVLSRQSGTTTLRRGNIGTSTLTQMYSNSTNPPIILASGIILFNDSAGTATFNGCMRDFKIVNGTYYNSSQSPTESISTIKTLQAYNYPACTGSTDCLTRSTSTRPRVRYDLSGERCVIGKDNVSCTGCLNSIDNYIYSYDTVISKVDSCNSEYDTRFNKVVGQYVKLIRTSGQMPLSIAHIRLYDRYNNSLIDNNTTAFVRPLSGTSYGSLAIDNDPTTVMTTGTNTLDPTNSSNIFILIDLKVDKEIMYLDIVNAPSMNLNNLRIIIADSNRNIVYQKDLLSI